MNERIRQLAEQANIHFSRVGILDGDPNGSARLVGYSKMERFAELIVRECAEICMKEFDTGLLMAPQAPWIAEQIVKHFGVEE